MDANSFMSTSIFEGGSTQVYVIVLLLILGSLYTLYSLIYYSRRRSVPAIIFLVIEVILALLCLKQIFLPSSEEGAGLGFIFLLCMLNFILACVFLAIRIGSKRINHRISVYEQKRNEEQARKELEEDESNRN